MTRRIPALVLSLILLIQGLVASPESAAGLSPDSVAALDSRCSCCSCREMTCCAPAPLPQTPKPVPAPASSPQSAHAKSVLQPPLPLPSAWALILRLSLAPPTFQLPSRPLPATATPPPFLSGGGLLI